MHWRTSTRKHPSEALPHQRRDGFVILVIFVATIGLDLVACALFATQQSIAFFLRGVVLLYTISQALATIYFFRAFWDFQSYAREIHPMAANRDNNRGHLRRMYEAYRQ